MLQKKKKIPRDNPWYLREMQGPARMAANLWRSGARAGAAGSGQGYAVHSL